MKTLIYGGCFADTEFKVEMVTLWARLTRYLNGHMDIILFDSASPFDPQIFLPKNLHIDVYRFEENVGHLSHGGGDGAGRTLMWGIKHAIEHDYDYAVHIGTDMFFAKPVAKITERMSRDSVKCCCLPNSLYQFLEWELSAYNLVWVRGRDFISKYNWQSVHGPYPQVPRPSLLKKIIPEWRLQAAAGDALWVLPYSGAHNADNRVTHLNMDGAFPYHPPVWLHMAKDIRTFLRFIEVNGITLP